MKQDFYKSMEGKYFAVRTYSHTDRRQLWKVLTRPCDLSTAEISAQIEAKEFPKEEAFVVRIVTENDTEFARNRQMQDAWHAGYKAAIKSVLEGRHCPGGLSPTVELAESS